MTHTVRTERLDIHHHDDTVHTYNGGVNYQLHGNDTVVIVDKEGNETHHGEVLRTVATGKKQ